MGRHTQDIKAHELSWYLICPIFARRTDLSSHECTVRTYVLKIPSVHNLFQRDDSQSKQFKSEHSPFFISHRTIRPSTTTTYSTINPPSLQQLAIFSLREYNIRSKSISRLR